MKRIIVFITTYERPEMLLNLLKQIRNQSKSYSIKLIINNDRSKSDYSKVVSYLRQYIDDFYYIEDNIYRGKTNYWHIINKVYEMISKEPFDYVIQIPDDINLVENFFDQCINQFDSIQDPDKSCLNISNDHSRNGHAFWVNVKPKSVKFKSYNYFFTGWVDMAYICTRRYFELLDYRIDKIDQNWSGKPGRSSGVGMQISKRLYAARASIYQVANSLIIHGNHESVMHREHRKQRPLITNHMKDSIVATMATMPSRINSLQEAVASLLPQVDELHIYLNDFETVPEFLKDPKLKIYKSQDSVGDLGDVGKFFISGNITGYHFPVDDDIIYPVDYVTKMIDQVEKYKRKYVIGLHGRIFGKLPVKTYYHGHTEAFRAFDKMEKDVFVHVTAMSSCVYHTDTFKIGLGDFGTTNMTDVWFSVKANNDNVPLLLVKHGKGWLKDTGKYNQTQSIYFNCHKDDKVQTDAINETKWQPLMKCAN